jgi:hypothetical protein
MQIAVIGIDLGLLVAGNNSVRSTRGIGAVDRKRKAIAGAPFMSCRRRRAGTDLAAITFMFDGRPAPPGLHSGSLLRRVEPGSR